ncbi:hypothetical protein B0T25DRAFT_609906 [Lasiosphaeria hispida]|uniref:Uncharacterized protein n=1 Tax=Lasiosphaeria hispida TaxID=260671 RepID=A0AAJ0MC48_9PEZI|nr:hypothetical protein B0T25DRAFT_609906 [Lasiosphaeria hispida]
MEDNGPGGRPDPWWGWQHRYDSRCPLTNLPLVIRLRIYEQLLPRDRRVVTYPPPPPGPSGPTPLAEVRRAWSDEVALRNNLFIVGRQFSGEVVSHYYSSGRFVSSSARQCYLWLLARGACTSATIRSLQIGGAFQALWFETWDQARLDFDLAPDLWSNLYQLAPRLTRLYMEMAFTGQWDGVVHDGLEEWVRIAGDPVALTHEGTYLDPFRFTRSPEPAPYPYNTMVNCLTRMRAMAEVWVQSATLARIAMSGVPDIAEYVRRVLTVHNMRMARRLYVADEEELRLWYFIWDY